ncbi:uncharacterized protein LOC124941700 [Impatiens glandulifera]|uniref:uncharacterized protein LOC124941700 n=1 Tax=Impatiens glandulifera TaxID=253017 RepID=UPI001FB10398|nr:uncharacterized protein LOC124941700 [Impatiens glandulifera]XP_047338004.1 uncharacterized protein LOC124941700 [Impatiens glandulifera]
MVNNQHYSRIDILELKDHIVRKIGHLRTEKYFDQLKRFFSFKITKTVFNRSCLRIIGRENISLHNQLIQSIHKNACLSKVPPIQRKSRTPIDKDRKFPNLQAPTEIHSLGSRPPIEVASVEDGEEVEQVAISPGIQSRSPPVTAPIGISMKVVPRRTTFAGSKLPLGNCENSCELPDSRSLRSRLERELCAKGITVSMDCVNLLNTGLDAYLKRLIEPCVGLAKSRCKMENRSKLMNHRRISYGPNGCVLGRYVQMVLPQPFSASMMDLRVSLQSNRRNLGEDWPMQFERASSLQDLERI